jgi:NAD(P)-dependent dehydrogenase (short-subunit alcohol dehydrogenase family)
MKKTAIVTGASSGIGAATVEQLLKDGWTVFACARRVDKMVSLEAKGAITLDLDVTKDESMRSMVENVIRQSTRIDALINNAGYGSYGALEDVPIEEGRYQFEVNVFGLARLTQLVLPYMRAQSTGKIVNITSIGGKIHEPLGSWYHATKFAVEGMSDCLRMEVKPFGIDVIIIEPGGIKTEWSGIAQQKVMEVSGTTVYQDQAKQRAGMLAYADRSSSDPTVIATVISEALRARKPKTRYAAGSGAFVILLLRRMLSDRGFDWVMETISRNVSSSSTKA